MVEARVKQSQQRFTRNNLDAIFAQDLNSNIQNCNVLDSRKDALLQNIFRLPLKKSSLFNVVTNRESVVQPPDMKVESDSSNFHNQYYRMLQHDRSFHKKLGYFTYASKN
jgi:hypothetical protein